MVLHLVQRLLVWKHLRRGGQIKKEPNSHHNIPGPTTLTPSKFDVILTVHRRQYVEIKCQLDATEVFIADLIVCSTCFGHHYAHHQELKSIMQWLLPVVFGAVVFKLLVWCGAEGYVSGLQDAAASLGLLMMGTVVPETC